MPYITRNVSVRNMLLVCVRYTLYSKLASGNGTCTDLFRSNFCTDNVNLNRLCRCAKILNRRCLRSVLLLRDTRISIRATLHVNRTRLRRHNRRAANESIITNRRRTLVRRLLRNSRNITRMLNVRDERFTACLVRNLRRNQTARYRYIITRISVVGRNVLIIRCGKQCRLLRIECLTANQRSGHAKACRLKTIKMLLHRKGQVLANECISIRITARI